MPNKDKTKTKGGITVTNLADDGKRPEPLGSIELPVRLKAKNEMALVESMADGSLGDRAVDIQRTFDGQIWLYVDKTCYVISFEDMTRAIVALDEKQRRCTDCGNIITEENDTGNKGRCGPCWM